MEKENLVPEANLSKTYKEVCAEFVKVFEIEVDGVKTLLTEDQKSGALLFAEHLDGSNVMSNELTLMAVMAAREVDREFILMLIDVVGVEKATELAKKLHSTHMNRGEKKEEVKLEDNGHQGDNKNI